MEGDGEIEIVMTPLQGSVRGKVIQIARVPKSSLVDANVQHFAGGPYKGIVINKAANERPDPGAPETERNFTAVIGDSVSKSREWRELRFWFQPDTRVLPQVREAITDTFFKELMDEKNFPKDYISFMKNLIILVKQYSALLKVEVEFRPLNPDEMGPTTIRKRKQIVRTSVIGGIQNGSSQVPTQDDIKVLLYSENVTQDQLEETLFAAGFMRAAPTGGMLVKRPGLRIQEDILVIIRQELNAGNDLEQALYNAGFVPNTEEGDKLFKAPGRSQEDMQRMFFKETVAIDELKCAIAESGFILAPQAVFRKQPGTRAQENIKDVVVQETSNGLELEQALFIAGFVPSPESGQAVFAKPGYTEDDIYKMLTNNAVPVEEINKALEEAGFVKAPEVGVVIRYPGVKGQDDIKQVLKQEVAEGMVLEEALFTAGFIPNPKNKEKVFASRSQDNIQQLLVKDTLTFDELNIALSDAGYVMAPGIGASLKYPYLDQQDDVKAILKKEVDDGTKVEEALWMAGYLPDPENAAPVFSAPGRSEEDIKKMIYRTSLSIPQLNTALQEAGFVRFRTTCTVFVQPGARAGEDLRTVLRNELSSGTDLQDALFVAGYVPKPDMHDQVWKADGFSKEDITTLLKKDSLTVEELEVAIYEAGFYRPPGLGVANRAHNREDVRYVIGREMAKGIELEDALYKAGYVKAPTYRSGITVRRNPTISRQGWEVLWKSKKMRVLQVLEDAYPNVMSTEHLIKVSEVKRNNMERILKELSADGSVQEIKQGNWMCVHAVPAPSPTKEDKKARTESMIARGEESSSDEEMSPAVMAMRQHDVKVVTHIPHLPKREQPTIAIITLLFTEKLAVEAMMHSKTTYIRYKIEGEGQVYTVGKIGKHRVVATKLARIGFKEDAMVAAGNTVTRMLGTFGEIEHVILVGVGGGVREEFSKTKLRLGDVVVTRPDPAIHKGAIYLHCTEVTDTFGQTSMVTQSWKPHMNVLQELVDTLEVEDRHDDMQKYRKEIEPALAKAQASFKRPAPESDRFYIPGENEREPQVHYGIVGSGKGLGKDDELRRQFAKENNLLVIDSGFQAIMQSIEGNRKDTFAVIRGISDYHDGTQWREWQAYAALAAAAYMKTLVLQIPSEASSDSD